MAHEVRVYKMVNKQSVLVVNMLDAGEMGKNLKDVDRGQIMARKLGQSILQKPKLMVCSWSDMVSYRQWSKEGQTTFS